MFNLAAVIDKSEVEPLIATHGYSVFNDMPGTGNAQWSLVKSCGPFMVESYDTVNSVVKMVPNPHWHGTPVSLTEWYLTFIGGKDNAVAALIALAGTLILGFPGGGYMYLDKMKKGIIYGIISWALIVVSVFIFILSLGFCFPIAFLPLLFDVIFAIML